MEPKLHSKAQFLERSPKNQKTTNFVTFFSEYFPLARGMVIKRRKNGGRFWHTNCLFLDALGIGDLTMSEHNCISGRKK
jgi:hypothetical protein